MRQTRNKFRKGQFVTVKSATRQGTQTGIVTAVISTDVSMPNRDTFTMYRYMVAMENAWGVFGASIRFVYEHELKAAPMKRELKTVPVKHERKVA